MLLIKPSDRRDLMTISFLKKVLDLIPEAARHISDLTNTSDEEFPVRVQAVL